MQKHNKHYPFRKRVVLILRRKILPLLLLFLLLLPQLSVYAEEGGPAAMILYEPRTGTVLEALNPDEPMLIASTTKIMTALVVLEHCMLHERVLVTEAQAEVEGSSAYLRAGETYTVEMLLYGLMLASGNDAACALAEHAAGSIEGFAELMNEKAAALGLENTHFMNPHGLDDEEHYSSARDLALLTAAAMENETFCRIFSAQSYASDGVEYQNHNKLLESCEGCLGGKTGYTRAAGRTLVSCAEREGMRLICVTLSDPNDWEDHSRSYDDAFAAYSYRSLLETAWRRLPVISGTAASVGVRCEKQGVLLHKGARTDFQVELPRFVFAPLSAGERVGSVTIYENGSKVFEAALFSSNAVARDEDAAPPPWKRFWRNWTQRCMGSLRYEEILA